MLDGNSVCYHHQRSVFGEVRYWLLPQAKKEWLVDSNIMEVDITVPVSPLHWHQRWSCWKHKTRAKLAVCPVGWHFPCVSTFHSCPLWIQVSRAANNRGPAEAEGKDPQWSHCLDRRRVVYLLFALLTESKSFGAKRRRDGPVRAVGSRGSHHLERDSRTLYYRASQQRDLPCRTFV